MPKTCRVKVLTKRNRKRKGFNGNKRKQDANGDGEISGVNNSESSGVNSGTDCSSPIVYIQNSVNNEFADSINPDTSMLYVNTSTALILSQETELLTWRFSVL